MSDVTHAGDVKRPKRETGEADSDSYEEYKSDEEGRGAGDEVDTVRIEEDKVKIISVQTDDKVVDGITEKENGDKKKDKKKKEKRSKHDKEGAETVDGQERKEKRKEKKSREGKKEKKPKEHKEKTDDVKTVKVAEVTVEEVSLKEQPQTVEKPHEKAEESKPAEATAAAAPVPEKVEDVAAPVAMTEAAPPKEKAEDRAEHPMASTGVTPPEAPLPETKEEKTVVPVVIAEVPPPHEHLVSEKKEDVVHPEAAPSEADAAKSTLSETTPVPAKEPLSESHPVAASQPPVAESNPPEPSPPSSDAVVAETGDHLPRKSDASDQEKASASAKREEPQAAHAIPTGVQKILEHARKEAEERATGSSRVLMARSLVSRQEKLQEQLTNMRHQFGDIDSEIRALKIDCYRNQRAFVKHQ